MEGLFIIGLALLIGVGVGYFYLVGEEWFDQADRMLDEERGDE